ncbi:TolC family protein [Pollutibacter soli]|uniref:TolC family protein n=1 Tax=Pollutibacter soli TaxID=3034157 RepID=UPI0030141992
MRGLIFKHCICGAIIFWKVFFPGIVTAQTVDSLKMLSQQEFLSVVRTFHPVALQAKLLTEMADAGLIAARAGFDPFFSMNGERKTFDGVNYYNWVRPELKIPTWFGIEVKAGLENNIGDYLNPEYTKGKSSYLGISLPVAKNLLMDKRRAVLKQARIFTDLSNAERAQIFNDLLTEANYSYWNWVKDYHVFKIRQEAVAVTQARYRLIKIGYQQGDRPAIDTTEALAQLESFQLAQNESQVKFLQSGLELSNYMWVNDSTPFYITPDVIPDTNWTKVNFTDMELPALEQLTSSAAIYHPKLMQFDYKIRILEIERRLKFQDLLPAINLKGNLLNSGYNVFENASIPLYENNYKFGFDIGVPLRFSQGRGEYRMAKLKLLDAGLDRSQTRLQIENKIKSVFTEVGNLQTQMAIAGRNYENYYRLFRGEETRFSVGESSLFILNSRENKVLETRQKLIELQTKFMQSLVALQGAAGLMQ